MAANPYFEIQSGADKRRLELDDAASEVVVGRASECQWAIPSSGVSRRHARISRRGSEVTIEDVGSSNGTFVNSERLSAPRVLQDKDLVRVGSVEMRFFAPAPDAGADATIALTPAARPAAPPATEPIPPPRPAQAPPSERPSGTASTTRSLEPPPRPSPPAAASASPPPAATAAPAPTSSPEPAPAWLSAADDAAEPTVIELLAIAAGSFLAVFSLGALLIRFVF